METVYVIDSSHPNGGYIANKVDVPENAKTMTIEAYNKKNKNASKDR